MLLTGIVTFNLLIVHLTIFILIRMKGEEGFGTISICFEWNLVSAPGDLAIVSTTVPITFLIANMLTQLRHLHTRSSPSIDIRPTATLGSLRGSSARTHLRSLIAAHAALNSKKVVCIGESLFGE